MRRILDNLKIFNALKSYNFLRLHMPGHKGKEEIFPDAIKNIFPSFDVTETFCTDNLLDPKGYIKEFLEGINEFFGSNYCFLSLQGSTHLLQASIAAFSNPYDGILINKDAHKSIYNIAKILKLDIEYIYPQYDDSLGILTYIDEKHFESVLQTSKSQIVVITSPSYYGIEQNVKALSDIAKKYQKKLIVDQAHGGYYKFVGKKTALDSGADICILSLHKTLPCPNQSALLLSNLADNDNKKLSATLGYLHTTSPSYVLLAWSEYGIEFSKMFGRQLFEELERKLEKLCKPVLEYTNYVYRDVDVLKLLLNFGKAGKNQSFVKSLLERYSIVPELFDQNRILFYFSLVDALSNFEILESFFYDIIKEKGKEVLKKKFLSPPRPKKVLKIYEVDSMKKRRVKICEAEGFVCAQAIIPYPPGFPVVVEGEVIEKDTIEYLQELLGIEFIKKNEVDVVEEG
ncbi:Orn/Lys/Arg decarboxylase major region [Caldicellulosiruptor hydrothermalis 108]|uniref:Orn/Lys/Arg decarboxylase major region n=1 Tax=Caldicellulosiruptor hydrothermalis (strain DSM 18901 / VKM B-2411 / 108) TaxID=632292 RepID=E4Q7U8_CALH1|nr:aminotransferase class I/II-fold pyridoxal phosphate-dependent enzyme [Caldicellulosiruptor hydrothermalis]ADQ07866.1 Orn/Lys/Arg decarboxylase major region [Caldicellulosiruptor hydrothermalis 108]